MKVRYCEREELKSVLYLMKEEFNCGSQETLEKN